MSELYWKTVRERWNVMDGTGTCLAFCPVCGKSITAWLEGGYFTRETMLPCPGCGYDPQLELPSG